MSPRSLLAVALLALAACSRGAAPAPTLTPLGSDFAPLRAAFAADSGKVRAIFLVSPT